MPRRDFTLDAYSLLLTTLSERVFQRFYEFCTEPAAQGIVLRHDVDARPDHALRFALMQHSLGIRGTYYFRIVTDSLNPRIVEEIAGLGHEIGYHYEDVSLAAVSLKRSKFRTREPEIYREKLLERALEIFVSNLMVLRKYADIRTICMHGSPLSPWDSRLLWTRYDYRNFGLIGEPYFDIDFSRVAYYTDTGRRWDGDKSIIRDRPAGGVGLWTRSGAVNRMSSAKTTPAQPTIFPKYHSTFDIILADGEGLLPDQIMFTFHPQRWHDRWQPWIRELVWQQMKNNMKYGLRLWHGWDDYDTDARTARSEYCIITRQPRA